MNIHTLQKLRDALLATLTALILFVVCVYVYSRFIEKPTLSYTDLPFPTLVKAVHPGEVVTAIATRCNSSSTTLTYRTSRTLKRENSAQADIILQSVEISAAPGCSPVSTKANVVPEDTLPGFYRFAGVALIKGLMYDHEVGWNTDVFEVVAKPMKVKP